MLLLLLLHFNIKINISIYKLHYEIYLSTISILYLLYVTYIILYIYIHRFILFYLGHDDRVISSYLSTFPASMGQHRLPFCWCTPWQMGSEFLVKCKMGVLQYVIIRTTNSILARYLLYILIIYIY